MRNGILASWLALACFPACKSALQAGVEYPQSNLDAATSTAASGGTSGSSLDGAGGALDPGVVIEWPVVDSGVAGGVDGGGEDGVEGGGLDSWDITANRGLCVGTPNAAQYLFASGYSPDPNVLAQVSTALASMSLFDEATQMRGMPYGAAGSAQMSDTQRSQDTSSLRGFRYRDGSRGMNLGEDMDGVKPKAGQYHGTEVGYSTVFPVDIARAAAFDLGLEHAVGEAIGDEMQAARQTVLLAPCVDVLRHPLWGRAQESYGEDPFLIGRLASAMATGAQQHIAAAATHFAAYNLEQNRDFNNSILDEQALREIYARPVRMVVQDGGVAGVMAAYNKVNGIKSTVNRHLLTDILRDDFGFRGFVLSDWWAMDPQTNLSVGTATFEANAIAGVTAGLDIEMPWSLNYSYLESIVNGNGGLTKADLDRSAARILEQKLRFNAQSLGGNVGLGTSITTYRNGVVLNNQSHIDLAQKAALESMVLLKNDNQTLPIAKSVRTVAVLGTTVPYLTNNSGTIATAVINFATDPNTGDNGSSRAFFDPAQGIGPFGGIQASAPAGVAVTVGSTAAEAAAADFVVVVAGLTAHDEGEDYTLASDRTSFALDAKQTDAQYQNVQNNLIAQVAALGKPMVVVLEGGSVIDMPWLASVPAVVMAWYSGMAGGAALGHLLWGDASFSGKLPFTWARQLSDLPPLADSNGSTTFDYYVGYRYFDKNGIAPLFPFGYGLSYTRIEYRKLELPCGSVQTNSAFPVQVTLANTGDVDADEIVMVFVSYPSTTARRPAKELKGFARVSIKAGQELVTTIYVRVVDLDYWSMDSGRWTIEPGVVQVHVGPNANDLPLSGTITVTDSTEQMPGPLMR
jgi:beta-glucosidase